MEKNITKMTRVSYTEDEIKNLLNLPDGKIINFDIDRTLTGDGKITRLIIIAVEEVI